MNIEYELYFANELNQVDIIIQSTFRFLVCPQYVEAFRTNQARNALRALNVVFKRRVTESSCDVVKMYLSCTKVSVYPLIQIRVSTFKEDDKCFVRNKFLLPHQCNNSCHSNTRMEHSHHSNPYLPYERRSYLANKRCIYYMRRYLYHENKRKSACISIQFGFDPLLTYDAFSQAFKRNSDWYDKHRIKSYHYFKYKNRAHEEQLNAAIKWQEIKQKIHHHLLMSTQQCLFPCCTNICVRHRHTDGYSAMLCYKHKLHAKHFSSIILPTTETMLRLNNEIRK